MTDCTTGAVRRFTLRCGRRWPGPSFCVLPVLIGTGRPLERVRPDSATCSDRDALQVENASYREATGQLAGQISALQTAVDDLGEGAPSIRRASRAMDKLPAIVKSRAMGGATPAPSARAGDRARLDRRRFGVLSDLLGGIGIGWRWSAPASSGAMRWPRPRPSIWPVAGWLTSSYGNRTRPVHRARAISIPASTSRADTVEPVLATADATVASAGANGDYGNMVVLDHGFGIVTKYGHLSRFAVIGRRSTSSAAT